jgi:hypothetical protein
MDWLRSSPEVYEAVDTIRNILAEPVPGGAQEAMESQAFPGFSPHDMSRLVYLYLPYRI